MTLKRKWWSEGRLMESMKVHLQEIESPGEFGFGRKPGER
jgi:hypothetical protein